MKPIRYLLAILTIGMLCSGCLARPTPTQVAGASWDAGLNATARVVMNATFFAPTGTFTPSPTATITKTPTPTPVTPTLTTTPALDTCIPPQSQTEAGQVIAVLDGETILVDIAGQEYKVRYIGVRAPRDLVNRKLFGDKAIAANRALVEGQTVKLLKDTSDTDRSGRLLRYVFAGDTFVNRALVRQGLATALSDPPDTACYDVLHQAEHEASVELAGMWSRPAPTKTPLGYGLERMTDVPCNCYADPDEINCYSFQYRIRAQACFDLCRSLGLHDVFHLDPSGDKIACDFLP